MSTVKAALAGMGGRTGKTAENLQCLYLVSGALMLLMALILQLK